MVTSLTAVPKRVGCLYLKRVGPGGGGVPVTEPEVLPTLSQLGALSGS